MFSNSIRDKDSFNFGLDNGNLDTKADVAGELIERPIKTHLP
jgi:hypothetical protein